MDLYVEAKIRQERRMEEAKTWRLMKLAKAQPTSEGPGAVRSFLALLGAQLALLGAKPQMECK